MSQAIIRSKLSYAKTQDMRTALVGASVSFFCLLCRDICVGFRGCLHTDWQVPFFLGGGESVGHFQFMLPMPCLKRLVCVFFLNQAYVGIGCRLFHLAREASQPTSCGRSVFASESELRALTWKRGGLWEDSFFCLWKLGFSATGNAEKIRRSLCRGVPQTKTGACRDDYSAARCARSIPSGLSGSPGIETRCGRQTKERWRKAFVHTPELRG